MIRTFLSLFAILSLCTSEVDSQLPEVRPLTKSDVAAITHEAIRGLSHLTQNFERLKNGRDVAILVEAPGVDPEISKALRIFVADSIQAKSQGDSVINYKIVIGKLERESDSTVVVHSRLIRDGTGKCSENAYNVLVVLRDGKWQENVKFRVPSPGCEHQY